jgi:hypothetical protein
MQCRNIAAAIRLTRGRKIPAEKEVDKMNLMPLSAAGAAPSIRHAASHIEAINASQNTTSACQRRWRR